MVKVLIKKLDPSVELPEYKTNGASGMDLIAFIKNPINLRPKTSFLVPTGLAVAFPENYEIQIRPRSGLAARNNISVLNTPGTIDADYRGEIKVILINHGSKVFEVTNKMRIAQMVVSKYEKVNFKLVSDLNATKRGSGGFGSTGTNW